jgi:hypothetical protein
VASERDELVELMVSYAAAIDRKDWGLFERCFTADVVALYEGFGEYNGYGPLERYTRSAVEPLDATQHLLTNFQVDLGDGTASFRCYVYAQHVRRAATGGELFTVGGQYENHAVLTEDGWRMDRFHFWPIWTSGNLEVVRHIEMDDRVEWSALQA